jgi:YidC/Oxa1 family membrane protein insertase
LILDIIIRPLAYILNLFHNYTDWGWSIVILTLLIKIILFPFSIKQIQSMEKMKRVQPKLKEIQDKYKDRPEEFQRRTMELYKKEKVNPLGGCLPMLIQLPVLWAIYALLTNPKYGVAGFISKDVFLGVLPLGTKNNIILAVISGASTFLQQKMTTPTAGTESSQQMFLYFTPVLFGFITWTVSAGIGLYWVASNIIGIAQQYLIYEYFIVKEHIQKEEGPGAGKETEKQKAVEKKK